MNFALDRDYIDANPVDSFRAALKRQRRTKAARAEFDAGSKAHPIEKAEELDGLVAAADSYRKVSQTCGERQGLRSLKDTESRARNQVYLGTLLMLDAGLRVGEALKGLRWSDVLPAGG